MQDQNQDGAAVTETPTPKVKDIKNGVTRPGAGTSTGRIWDIAESLTVRDAEGNILTVPERKAVVAIAEGEGLEVSTTTTQFGKWRTYNGLVKAPKTAATTASAATTSEELTEEEGELEEEGEELTEEEEVDEADYAE